IDVTPESDLTDDNETLSVPEDGTLNGNLLTNAASTDGTPVITEFTVGGNTFTVDPLGTTATLAEGSLTINPNGTFTFVPTADYNGPVPEVVYTISDGVNTDTSTLNIEVTPESDLTDDNETLSVPEDGTLNGNLLTNAASTDGTPTITEFTVGGNTFTVDPLGTTATITEGSLTINPNGTFTFVPTADYNGPVPEVVYTISDGVNTETSTLNIEVTPESDLTDDNETLSVAEDGSLSGDLLTNAASTDGTPVITEFTVGGNTFTVDPLGTTATLAEGSLTINPNGTFTFVPTADYNGAVPEVVYTVSDGVNTDTSTLNIEVTPESDLTDDNETLSVAEDGSLSGDLLANATSTDGTPTITEFTVGGNTFTVDPLGTTATLAEGELTINPNGTFTFVPTADYNGPVPEVLYTVSDGVNTDTSTLNIEVTPENIPPIATDDSFSVDEGQMVSGNVITHNDGDGKVDSDGGDGAALSITQVNGNNLIFDPADGYATIAIQDGILRINAQGNFTYQNSGFTGGSVIHPSFDYTLSDGTDTDTATVSIEVSHTAPTANADSNFITLTESNNGIATVSRIKGNLIILGSSGDVSDTSADGVITLTHVSYNGQDYVFDSLNTSYDIVAEYGTFTVKDNGAYIYTSKSGMLLPLNDVTDVITYTIQDGDTVKPDSDTTTLTIHIDVPDPVPSPLFINDANDFSGVSFNKSTTIDTSNLQKVSAIGTLDSPEDTTMHTNALDLSDIISDGSSNSIEKFLQFSHEDDEIPTEPNLVNEQTESIEQVVLEKSEQQSITNDLLADGAVIISDNSVPTTIPLADLDSSDIL
ncbi:Ig-like domain-containing protein, partial [Colwellia sp. UCD-KL20]|uniref:beta strand repeat-containing protein n=1 Tax=Colwellia sp. UCD-KL20 TaxID=1917165 RepID=UPI001177F80E